MTESIGLSSELRRDARLIGLLFASTTSVIGSGWLFGAFHASRLAGPLSIWSWMVGGVIILLIALCFAELATLFPRSGALVHYHFIAKHPARDFGWRYVAWLLPWFGGMWVLSGLSGIEGGLGLLSFWAGVIAVTIWSVIVMWLAVRSSLSAEETAEIMLQIGKTP
jgi:amino acid transporter